MLSTARKQQPIIPRDNVISFPGANTKTRKVIAPRGEYTKEWGTWQIVGTAHKDQGILDGDVVIFDRSRLRPAADDLCVFKRRNGVLGMSTAATRPKWTQLLGVVIGFQRFMPFMREAL